MEDRSRASRHLAVRKALNNRQQISRARAAAIAALLISATLMAPSTSHATVTTHGGPVETNPRVYQIYWGKGWTEGSAAAARTEGEAMYNQISGSAWQGILTQYSGPEGPNFKFVSNALTVGHPYVDGGPEPSGINEAKMQEEIEHAITAANGLGYGWPTLKEAKTDINDQFVLFTTPVATYAPSVTYCGAHFHYHSSGGNGYTYDAVRWNPPGCSLTITGAHEYAEAVSDPYLTAWRDWPLASSGGEIADICGPEERGFLPGGTEVPALWDNSSKGPFGVSEGYCGASDASPSKVAPEILTEAATATPVEATLHGTVTPNGLNVGRYYFEWGTGKYGHRTTSKAWCCGPYGSAVSAVISGLQPGTTYHFRLVVEGPEESGVESSVLPGKDLEIHTPDNRPIVVTGGAEEVAGRVFALHGTVNPNGFPTTYRFYYATGAEGFEHFVEGAKALTGTTAQEVVLKVEGLARLTTYRYVLVASNEGNGSLQSRYGEEGAFTTPDWRPTATTGAASDVRLHRGTLNGTVNPHGLDTTYHFEYLSDATCQGNVAKLGKGHCFDGAASAPIAAEGIGSASKGIALSKTVEGLQPWVTYDYRIVATNAEATTYGEAITFATNGKWTLEAPPDPKASNSSTLADLSCTSQSSCLAVGYDNYVGRSLGEFWNGTKWSLIIGGEDQYPSAISCGSSTSCWAVGSKLSDGSPLVQRWYGEEGRWEGFAATKLVTPTGGTNVHVKGIACTGETECTAVGYYLKEGHNRALVERLKSSTWTLQSTPEVADAVLEDISCTSTSACTAVGYRSAALFESFAEHWDGEKWSTVSVPAPPGKGWELLRLTAISCTAANSCVATGNFSDPEFEEGLPFAATYDGSKFSLTSMPKLKEDTELGDVSCTSSTSCLAVGQASGGSSTLALSWNGSEWSTQASPTPSGKTAFLTGVSCNSPLACTMVGWDYGSGEWLTLAERWE